MKPAEELAFSKRTSSKKSNIKENSLSLGSNVACNILIYYVNY